MSRSTNPVDNNDSNYLIESITQNDYNAIRSDKDIDKLDKFHDKLKDFEELIDNNRSIILSESIATSNQNDKLEENIDITETVNIDLFDTTKRYKNEFVLDPATLDYYLNSKTVNLAIKNNDIDTLDKFESIDLYYPLHSAILLKNKLMLEYLIKRRCNINAFDIVNDESPLMLSIKSYVDIFYLLYNDEIDINIQNKAGCNVLHYSVIHNQIDILKFLITKVKDIYAKSALGNNICHMACGFGRSEILEYLISIGYNINLPNYTNRTALHYSVREGYTDYVAILLNNNINIHFKDNERHPSYSALHYSVQYDRLDILKLFVHRTDYDLYDTDIDGNNILHIACKESFLNIIEYLLSIEYNVNHTNNFNQTALHLSVKEGFKEIVELLISRKIILTVKDNNGLTGFHYSVWYNQLEILKYFIDNNLFDKYEKTNNNETILEIANTYGHKFIVEYLKSIDY